jgi:hypothetical protein
MGKTVEILDLELVVHIVTIVVEIHELIRHYTGGHAKTYLHQREWYHL